MKIKASIVVMNLNSFLDIFFSLTYIHYLLRILVPDFSPNWRLIYFYLISIGQIGDHVSSTGDHVSITDDHVSITDDHVSITDDHVSITDDRVSITDDRVSSTGYHVSITGYHVSITDDHVSITDDHVSITGHHVSITDDHVSITDDRVPITDDRVSITDNRVSITDDHVSITDDHVSPLQMTMSPLQMTMSPLKFVDYLLVMTAHFFIQFDVVLYTAEALTIEINDADVYTVLAAPKLHNVLCRYTETQRKRKLALLVDTRGNTIICTQSSNSVLVNTACLEYRKYQILSHLGHWQSGWFKSNLITTYEVDHTPLRRYRSGPDSP